jgi:hypothetical protein
MANSKLNTTKLTIDAEVKDLLIAQTKNLIQQIQEDIRQDQKLSEETKKNCQSILDQAQRKYNNSLITFLEETKILINTALRRPISERNPIQQAWKHTFDIHISQCNQIIGPILHVLNVLIADSKALQQKYRLYLAGGAVSTVIVGGSVIALGVHFYRVSSSAASCACFACTPVGLGCIIGGISLVAALALILFCGCISTASISRIYEKCCKELQLFLVTAFPDFFNDSNKPITAAELEKVIGDAINILKIDDKIWSEDTTLESLDRVADANLKYLREKS